MEHHLDISASTCQRCRDRHDVSRLSRKCPGWRFLSGSGGQSSKCTIRALRRFEAASNVGKSSCGTGNDRKNQGMVHWSWPGARNVIQWSREERGRSLGKFCFRFGGHDHAPASHNSCRARLGGRVSVYMQSGVRNQGGVRRRQRHRLAGQRRGLVPRAPGTS